MRRELILLFVIFSLIGIVSADIVSINSGGGEGLIINPNQLIEGFFSFANNLPLISNVVLFSTYGTNLTTENLTVTFDAIDEDGHSITNITDWRIDGNSLAVLNMPFDTMESSVAVGKIRDYSTYENNGTLGDGNEANKPIWNSSCQVGGCFYFDGDNSLIRSINSNVYSGNQTFMAWVNAKSLDGMGGILSLHDHAAEANFGLNRYGTHFSVSIGYTDGTREYSSKQTFSSILIDDWNHVVLIYDESINKVSFYVNGDFDREWTLTKTPAFNSQKFLIGQWSNTYLSNYEFNGSIDELKFFHRTLSQEQIKEIYNAEFDGHSIESFMSQETDVGETWQVAMTPNDAIGDGITILSNELEILNEAPTDPNPYLYSFDGTNETTGDLICNFDVLDIDNSLLDIEINWTRNGTDVYYYYDSDVMNGTSYDVTLDKSNLAVGDIWTCNVRYYDGYDYSNWVESNSVTIIDVTAPNITIISPLPTNYSTVNIDFNVSINENVSICYYDLDDVGNISMTELNSTYYFTTNASIGPGPHDVVFWCMDLSGNWGMNETNFSVDNEAAISIQLSANLSDAIRWDVVMLPADDLDALGNNLNESTGYFMNISAVNTLVDIYVRANSSLFTSAFDEIGLDNETFAVSLNDSTVSNITKIVMGTTYIKIASSVGDNSTLFMKFYLDAPAGQAAGVYLNQLNFVAVREGEQV